MGRWKQKSSESIAPQCNGDSSESGRSRDTSQVPEKKNCMHINKAVDQNGVRKHFKNISCNLLKCTDCDVQELCICLNCGQAVCTVQHALKHEETPRSDPHCMMLDTTKWTVWCYKCDSRVLVDASKKLRSTVDYIQGHIDKLSTSLPVSSEPIPLGPPLPSEKKVEVSPNINSLNNKKKGNGPVSKQNVAAHSCKIRGLQNMGNTCFFNSVLQCLSQTPNLLESLKEMKQGGEQFTIPPLDEGDEELTGELAGWGPITEQLSRTLSEMCSGAQSVYSPRPLLEELRKKCAQFRGYDQHDAHELLRELLYAVRMEDLKRYQRLILVKLFKTTKVNPADLNPEEKAKAKRLDNKISEMVSTKPIDVFQGKTECVHQCQVCKHCSCKVEPFMDLSLPVLSEKPQPPNCKRSREDSTSEEPKLSKHQLKKLNKQKHRKGGTKGNNRKQWNNGTNKEENNKELTPNTTDKSNAKSSSDSEKAPHQQESGYNSDKGDSTVHTAQNFMDSYVPHVELPSPLRTQSNASSVSLEDCPAVPLLDDSPSLPLEFDDDDFPPMPSLFDEIPPLPSPDTAKTLDQTNAIENPQPEFDFDSFNAQDVQNLYKEKTSLIESPNNKYEDVAYRSTGWTEGAWSSELLTVESLPPDDYTSSRSSSQFHESGIGSQSIDEVSSTHPSEGMCSTESCNGGPSSYGDEFQHVENKTSIPESGIGSMTEEVAALSIMDSDPDNGSPDSMQANRSSGSKYALTPCSDDSCHKRNLLRSCNSFSNLSGEDASFYQSQPAFDSAYLNEKLLGSSRRDTAEEGEREYHSGEGIIDTGDKMYDQYDYVENSFDTNNCDNQPNETQALTYEPLEDPSPSYGPLPNEEVYGPVPNEEEREDDGEEGDREEEEGDGEKKELSEDEEDDYEQNSNSNGETLSPRLHGNDGECSLLSCLNQYTGIELLAGNNRVTCDQCTKKCNRGTNKTDPVKTAATLQTLIISPPPVLICHLKRFQLTYHSLKKITKSVPFPMKLSIGSFCSSKCQGISKDQKDVQYSLYGIVEHSGSLHGGHYVAYVKTSSGQWYYASDSRVHPISEDKVLKAEAYLLFYHRTC